MRKQNKKCKSLRTLQYIMQGSFFVSKNLTKHYILLTQLHDKDKKQMIISENITVYPIFFRTLQEKK